MYRAILTLALAFGAVAAQADTVRELDYRPYFRATYQANVTTSSVDPGLGWNRLTGRGTINVDFIKQQATLELDRAFHCPPGLLCALSMPAPTIVQLPIISVMKDECGVVTIRAKRDERPVDGIMELLEIVDNSENTCPQPMFMPYSATTVRYQTAFYARLEGREAKTSSTFFADKLRRQ